MSCSQSRLSEGGLLYPASVDVLMTCLASPDLEARTRISDANAHGVKVADVTNMVKVSGHGQQFLLVLCLFLSLFLYRLSILDL